MRNAAASPDAWPSDLDALIAAPEHHRLRFENERVRVLETVIPAGATTALHTHRWPALYLIESWSPHVRRDDTGKVVLDTRDGSPPDGPVWSEPIGPHTLENVGPREIRLVSVEIKSHEGAS